MIGCHELRAAPGVLLHAQDAAHAAAHGAVEDEQGLLERGRRGTADGFVIPLQAVLQGCADASRPGVQAAGGEDLPADGLGGFGGVRTEILEGHPRALQDRVADVEAVELFLVGGIQGVLLRHVPRGGPGGLHVGGKEGRLIELVGSQDPEDLVRSGLRLLIGLLGLPDPLQIAALYGVDQILLGGGHGP